jgi:uncharacterized protein (TIGR02118 family)
MAVQLVVLYPHPTDVDAFEKYYLKKHVPTMTEGAERFKVATLRTVATPFDQDGKPPYYRVAVIDFRDVQHFNQFLQSEQSKLALESAMKVSTGGPPMLLLCQSDS